LKRSSARIAAEQKWHALTGGVVEIRAEEDGDLHIALQDATGDKPGIAVAEIPAKPQKEWCELRKIVFGWTPIEDRAPAALLHQIKGPLKKIEASSSG
jgi:hypothetical protein